MKRKPKLSIIIPAYNEISRIQNLKEIISYFNDQHFTYEIIVVDDGSTDSTPNWLKKFNSKSQIKILRYKNNKGKGYAIKYGMLKANGSYRLFFDIDLSTPLQEFKKFIPHLNKYHLVIASRKTKGAKLLKRQPKVREFLGKGFTLLSQKVLDVDISDFTCGFKCFSEEAAKIIFNNLTINRWGFDSEIFYIAKKKHLTVKEIPVKWVNDPNSRVKFPQDLISPLLDLIKIRFNDLKGLYK